MNGRTAARVAPIDGSAALKMEASGSETRRPRRAEAPRRPRGPQTAHTAARRQIAGKEVICAAVCTLFQTADSRQFFTDDKFDCAVVTVECQAGIFCHERAAVRIGCGCIRFIRHIGITGPLTAEQEQNTDRQ